MPRRKIIVPKTNLPILFKNWIHLFAHHANSWLIRIFLRHVHADVEPTTNALMYMCTDQRLRWASINYFFPQTVGSCSIQGPAAVYQS